MVQKHTISSVHEPNLSVSLSDISCRMNNAKGLYSAKDSFWLFLYFLELSLIQNIYIIKATLKTTFVKQISL